MADYLSLVAAANAAAYDRYLGPPQFEPYARDLAGRLGAMTDGDLLETAAGTGVLTRVLARTLPEAVRIVATDLNPARLDYAAAQPGAARVSWQQADALALPFENASFDAVVCQFGVMFFPDKIAGYREVLRVLRPGGRFLFNVWDRIEANELNVVFNQVLATQFSQDPPQLLAPFQYHQPDTIADEARCAGFHSVAVESLELINMMPSARDLAIGLCQGTTLAGDIESRRPGGLAGVTENVAAGLAARLGTGPIAGRMRAHVVSASR